MRLTNSMLTLGIITVALGFFVLCVPGYLELLQRYGDTESLETATELSQTRVYGSVRLSTEMVAFIKMTDESPAVSLMEIVAAVAGILLIVAGVGLLNNRNWGRALTPSLGMLAVLASFTLGLMVVFPTLSIPEQRGPGIRILALLILSALPVLALFVFCWWYFQKPGIRAQFAAPKPGIAEAGLAAPDEEKQSDTS